MAFGEVGTSLSKIKANSLNLAGTFGFTGTVSGLADETPLVLISTFTSDGSDATASFTSGIDSTYKEYLFVFNNIHPETDGVRLTFQGSTDGGSNYNTTITSTCFRAQHDEGSSDTNLLYNAAADQAQGTAFQKLMDERIGNDNDQSASGILRLYNPSSTTFVKHFLSTNVIYQKDNYVNHNFVAGYFNTTSAINAIQFKMDSDEIQGGTIDLFGVV
jgi:hypothetical protein